MKHLIKISFAFLMAISVLAACKKGDEAPMAPVKETKEVEPDPQLAIAAPAGHYALGAFTGVGNRFFRYAGGPNYVGVIGTFGDNYIRNAVGNAPLQNVTGLAVVANVGYCLSRPAAGLNWQIWRFPAGNPNTANLWSTIGGSAAFVLSDIEKDPTANRVFLLNRTTQHVCNVPFVAGATGIVATGGYGGLVPNVSGLATVGSNVFILGQNGATGYLMRCNAALVPAWGLPLATYTPPGIPFAVTESGCFYDATISNGFVVGSQAAGLNWTQAVPVGGPGAAVPPVWQASNIRMIDFSPL
jgi:hypothetical protein